MKFVLISGRSSLVNHAAYTISKTFNSCSVTTGHKACIHDVSQWLLCSLGSNSTILGFSKVCYLPQGFWQYQGSVSSYSVTFLSFPYFIIINHHQGSVDLFTLKLFKKSSRFIAKLRGRSRNFTCTASPASLRCPHHQHPAANGTFVTSDKPALTYHIIP